MQLAFNTLTNNLVKLWATLLKLIPKRKPKTMLIYKVPADFDYDDLSQQITSSVIARMVNESQYLTATITDLEPDTDTNNVDRCIDKLMTHIEFSVDAGPLPFGELNEAIAETINDDEDNFTMEPPPRSHIQQAFNSLRLQLDSSDVNDAIQSWAEEGLREAIDSALQNFAVPMVEASIKAWSEHPMKKVG